ncbi:MAG: hypothetical protein HY238_23585, partial [Acidobacteria bacterium]|nr:hypothetical protein [Acidobacteriota bacterium]
MAAWVSFTLLMLVFVGRQDALLAGVMTLFLAWRHRKNFQNLLVAAALVL